MNLQSWKLELPFGRTYTYLNININTSRGLLDLPYLTTKKLSIHQHVPT